MTQQSEDDRRITLNRRGFLGMGAAGTAVALTGLVARPAGAATPEAGAVPDAATPAVQAKDNRPAATRLLTAQALGVNTTNFDGNFADPTVPGLLADAHIGRVRYPGGSGADFTNWMQSTVPLPWPEFMQLLDQIGAAPMITINYGQGAGAGPDLAAAWVGNALTIPNYDSATAVWVIGNEGYGPWEIDQHTDPHTPQSYATNVRPFFEAMHRVDPSTRVGFPMTISRDVSGGTGTWVADPDLWNRTIMAANADQIDFIDFHWYPVFGIPVLTNSELFEFIDRIPGAIRHLRSIIDEHRPGIPIVVSESNISQSEIVYNVQPVAALYAVATALTFLSAGVESYMWWQVHNSDDMDGDFGFLSNGTGTPGPSATTLASAAAAGDVTVTVADATGLHYGHQFTIDTGDAQESRKITALPGATTLSAPAAAGDRTVFVSATSTLTTIGATTDYDQFFGPGTPVTIGSESHTVVSVGTGASTGTLAAPANSGDTVVKVVGVGMGGQAIPVFLPTGLAPGGALTIGTGSSAETATIKSLGTSSSLGTTLAAPAAAGSRTIYVASVANTNTGIANYVGDDITIDTGSAEEVRRIVAVGSGAATPTVTVAALAPGDRTLFLAGVAGITVGHPLLIDTGSGQELVTAVADVGAQTTATLTAAAAAGDTTISVSSTAGLTAGGLITIGTGTSQETATVASLGFGSPTVTLAAPLTLAHAAGASVVGVGTGVILSQPVTSAHPAGVTVVDVGSGITLSAPLAQAHATGAATRDTGSGVTLTRPLRSDHADGETITTPGTGIVLDQQLAAAHASGDAITSSGITITPALGRAHPAGTSVNELGLKEPPLDTPLPAYWGFVLASHLAVEGAHLTDVSPDAPGVRAFASYRPGTEAIALLNTDDANPVTLRVSGLGSQPDLTSYSYGLENPSITQATASVRAISGGITLAPESIVVLVGTAGRAEPRIAVHVTH